MRAVAISASKRAPSSWRADASSCLRNSFFSHCRASFAFLSSSSLVCNSSLRRAATEASSRATRSEASAFSARSRASARSERSSLVHASSWAAFLVAAAAISSAAAAAAAAACAAATSCPAASALPPLPPRPRELPEAAATAAASSAWRAAQRARSFSNSASQSFRPFLASTALSSEAAAAALASARACRACLASVLASASTAVEAGATGGGTAVGAAPADARPSIGVDWWPRPPFSASPSSRMAPRRRPRTMASPTSHAAPPPRPRRHSGAAAAPLALAARGHDEGTRTGAEGWRRRHADQGHAKQMKRAATSAAAAQRPTKSFTPKTQSPTSAAATPTNAVCGAEFLPDSSGFAAMPSCPVLPTCHDSGSLPTRPVTALYATPRR
mmetsp:Transcript_94076/g.236130  ORF Transcript_94076/g.236130 Transcript_94076/m.236130 type:complete len:387 (+) Transcript_94076:1048-2208(+)